MEIPMVQILLQLIVWMDDFVSWTTPLYRVVLENKMALFFGVYLINVFAQNAAQTGAFEIVHNGKTVFSKLQESRLPNIQEIVNGLSRNGLKTV